MMNEANKNIEYWKKNGEGDYINTPISVLRYISELEKENEQLNSNLGYAEKEIEEVKRDIKILIKAIDEKFGKPEFKFNLDEDDDII